MKISQETRLLNLLSDGKPHNTIEILEVVYGGSHLQLARVGARIFGIKMQICECGWKHLSTRDKKEYPCRCLIGFDDKQDKTIYWYQLTQTERFVESEPEESEREITWASGNQLDLAI